ncbi:FAD-dependent oxidoreductase [Marinovum sp. 2_MG-2023]|uniref:GcvT family protein n=1 Tax=unclassified Marinovum TaxID=2647166 RepID=UPI0026E20E6A|nr:MULTISPECIES: FAD-dependent oxidoreductase [unclassified Marinovum]MDO6729995.1 FAD-dependent oxidoreductase [Marinovum sp. 2_MG-2023]MDO6779809.1 FAD-dependent oxidoreductase [Marinovum sp. 1_MG-2023]
MSDIHQKDANPRSFPTQTRVVIIGGGAVGVSCAYHIARAGWDVVVLEKNELTAGSTWHAAGNCPNFSTNWAVMNMQRYSLDLYRRLSDEVDYPINYHVTGSIRLGHSRERMMEFGRALSMGNYQGLSLEMLQVSDLKDRYPFMEVHDLAGALYDPDDGDIDPAQLTQALARGARIAGAQIERFCPATGVSRKGDQWIVHTEKGDIACEKVVNAAGYYAQRVGEWFKPYGGRTVPMTVMSHQYFLTEPVQEIEDWTKEHGKLPLLRDVDSSYYLRQEKTGLNLGPYERNCRAHWVAPDDPMPDDFSFQLYPDDLERLEWYIEDAMARVPILGTSGVGRVINGPIPYAPDGLPLIGPMPGVTNAYEACVFTFGITQAGGAGKVLAEWVTEGQTEWDMWAVDPRRYTGYVDQDYCNAKAIETYGHEYAMHFPHHSWPAGRDKRLSPLHSRLLGAGAQLGVYNGWERANWFAAPGDDTSEEATQTWHRNGPWQARIREECEAVRDHCGILAISGFTRLKVEGPGARAYVDGLTASRLPKPGRVGLAYFADTRGRILTETSVMVHGEDEVGLITAAMAQWHDGELLSRQAPDGIVVSDHSDAVECLLVTGPKAREILEPLTDHDLTKPWLSVSFNGQVAGRDAALVRVSYAGELGWEIHCAAGDAPAIWDAVTAAGARPIGMYALNSLRLEKGYRAWKGDLSSDYTLLEGGLDRFIDWSKEFPGKSVLEAEKQHGSAKRFVTLIVDAGDCDAPYMATLWHDGAVVGEVTSGGWGYRVDASIALGMIRADLAAPGTEVEVDIFGERRRATVQPDAPLWDAINERIRA